jgi:pSer/pThr/pTyr-binding forkhead associated (FHA) protein
VVPTVTLTVVEGPHKGQELICTDLALVTIGRAEDCAFRLRGELADLFVSRRHCLIRVGPEGVELRDLESRNGTYVNGRRVGFPVDGGKPDGSAAFKRLLGDGDRIGVGSSVLQVAVRKSTTGPVPSGEAECRPTSAAAPRPEPSAAPGGVDHELERSVR